jgi:O-antigen/teichoic acid export membrane protein
MATNAPVPDSDPSAPVETSRAEPPTIPGPDQAGGIFGRFTLLFGAEVACRAMRFLADIVLVRHFGQSVFGQLNVAQSLTVQGTWVATCGLNTAGVRSVAARPDAAPTIAATVVVLRCCLAAVTWGIVCAIAWAVPPYRDSLQLTALYSLSLFTGALNIAWVAQGRGDVSPLGVGLLAVHVVYVAGVQLVTALEWPLVAVPLILVGAEILTAVGVWLWVVTGIGRITRPMLLSDALRFFREALPIGGAALLRGMLPGTDVLLLGLFVAKAQVGQYSAAVKLYSLGFMILSAWFAVLLPQLSRHAAESMTRVRGAVSSGIRRTLLAAVPVTVAALLLGPAVLRLLFGPDFGEAAPALRILLLVLPLQLVSGHGRMALVALGRQRYDLGLVAVSAAVHVAAKLALIPALGMIGAAWGTFAGETALVLLTWYATHTVFREGENGV